ncbi:MAG TPA: CHRD domain-containing protein [Acetobacteraceae bacterium]|nr:CHRD domain-containing protein [Acetobacteraceae bacterium]
MSVSRRAFIALVPLAFAGSTTAALAATTSFDVPLTGGQQVPPVDTSGSGTAHLTYNPATRVVTWSITYSKLSSPATMAHFHDGAEGANGPVVIWLSTKGKAPASPFKGKVTLTPAQAQQFLAGDWYVNVHTKDHPAGEIRGQVMPPKS